MAVAISDPASPAYSAKMKANRQSRLGHGGLGKQKLVGDHCFFLHSVLFKYIINCLCTMRVSNGMGDRKCTSFTHLELEKEKATLSSILAWRIPWIEETIHGSETTE